MHTAIKRRLIWQMDFDEDVIQSVTIESRCSCSHAYRDLMVMGFFIYHDCLMMHHAYAWAGAHTHISLVVCNC